MHIFKMCYCLLKGHTEQICTCMES